MFVWEGNGTWPSVPAGASDAPRTGSRQCGAHAAAHVAAVAEEAAGPPMGHNADEQQDDEYQ